MLTRIAPNERQCTENELNVYFNSFNSVNSENLGNETSVQSSEGPNHDDPRKDSKMSQPATVNRVKIGMSFARMYTNKPSLEKVRREFIELTELDLNIGSYQGWYIK